MKGLNRITIVGNLGQDPELRYSVTKQDAAYLRLRVAVNERVKRRDEWVEETEWFSAIVFGKRAEALSKLLAKGSAVLLEGPMRRRAFEDREGNQREVYEVLANEVILLGGDGGRGERRRADNAQGESFANDDIPF